MDCVEPSGVDRRGHRAQNVSVLGVREDQPSTLQPCSAPASELQPTLGEGTVWRDAHERKHSTKEETDGRVRKWSWTSIIPSSRPTLLATVGASLWRRHTVKLLMYSTYSMSRCVYLVEWASSRNWSLVESCCKWLQGAQRAAPLKDLHLSISRIILKALLIAPV